MGQAKQVSFFALNGLEGGHTQVSNLSSYILSF